MKALALEEVTNLLKMTPERLHRKVASGVSAVAKLDKH